MSVREHKGVIFTHELATTVPILDFAPLKVFGMCWKRLKEWFNSPVNTKSQPKFMQLDGNKCCDIA